MPVPASSTSCVPSESVTWTHDAVISELNLHPFRFAGAKVVLAHNGHLRDFDAMRYDLLEHVRPEIGRQIAGTTDSEWIYALVLSQLADPEAMPDAAELATATVRVLEILRDVRAREGIDTSSPVNLFLATGRCLVATRYVLDYGWYPGDDPMLEVDLPYVSLWYTAGQSYVDSGGEWQMLGGDDDGEGRPRSLIIASEPLTADTSTWMEVPEYSMLCVSQDDDGNVDFFDTSYTQNGRATFSFSAIDAADARELQSADFLLILNRNENVIPAIAKLEGPQAAAYFMLGETKGTAAGGAEEAGKSLRVPGTNPFFPMLHDLQGNRFLELLEEHPLEVYLMNTGRVGGSEDDDRSKKVRIKHSSAIVKGIAEGTIEWERDPDFGYHVAAAVPGIDDVEVLQPRRLYERTGRAEEYRSQVDRLKAERTEFLGEFGSLSAEIVAAVS